MSVLRLEPYELRQSRRLAVYPLGVVIILLVAVACLQAFAQQLVDGAAILSGVSHDLLTSRSGKEFDLLSDTQLVNAMQNTTASTVLASFALAVNDAARLLLYVAVAVMAFGLGGLIYHGLLVRKYSKSPIDERLNNINVQAIITDLQAYQALNTAERAVLEERQKEQQALLETAAEKFGEGLLVIANPVKRRWWRWKWWPLIGWCVASALAVVLWRWPY